MGNDSTHLDEGVNDTNISTGGKHLVETSLPVHQLQLVELLIILEKDKHPRVNRGTDRQRRANVHLWRCYHIIWGE